MCDLQLPAPWTDWQQLPLPGDASARRFTRVADRDGQTAMVMETPLDEAESQNAFARITQILQAHDLIAPEILYAEGNRLVLSDLGQTNMADALLQKPEQAQTLYTVATDVLLQLHRIPTPEGLIALTPQVGGDMVRITADRYCGNPAYADDLADAMTAAMVAMDLQPMTLALRDFHAENLIWRPDARGTNRLGLLDFQDAFVAPPGYDLVSLLRDARRDVDGEIYEMIVERFCRVASLDKMQFCAQLACLGVQRNLRILGVFARLARDLEKARYIPMLPRVYHHIQTDLHHPEMAPMRSVVNALVPPPEAAMKRWKAA